MERTSARGIIVAWLFAVAWGVLPAAPALAKGELIGHGYTDLYMQVWGMWFLGSHWPLVPTHTTLFGFPDGMPSNLVTALAAQQIYVAPRLGRMRVSPHVYNDEADVDRFVAAVKSAVS